MAGQDVPRLFCSDTDRDGDFDGAVPDPLVVAELLVAFHHDGDVVGRMQRDSSVGWVRGHERDDTGAHRPP